MIIGTITVYRCDHDGCDAHKSIESDGLDGDKAGWFIGVYHHYCPAHRDRGEAVSNPHSAFRIPQSTPEVAHV